MCNTDVGVKNYVFNKMEIAPGALYRDYHAAKHFLHPFFKGTDETGGFQAGAFGDNGDERLLMQGRVNDLGTYRVEKELDACPWDIMGSEICRVSTASLEEIGRAYGKDCEYSLSLIHIFSAARMQKAQRIIRTRMFLIKFFARIRPMNRPQIMIKMVLGMVEVEPRVVDFCMV